MPQLKNKTTSKRAKNKNSRYAKGQQKHSLKRVSRIERIAYALEHSKMLEYIDDSTKPRRLIVRNFFIGVARGVGLTIGTAFVIAVFFKIMQHLISMNIPFLTDMLVEFVQFIKAQVLTNKPS